MKKIKLWEGIVAPLDRQNVDTDAIIPKQFLKSIYRTGLGNYLFDEWRYLDYGELGQDCRKRPINKEFILNKNRFKNSSILLSRSNFGCGSSREHAPWALENFGFKVIIAESFADIFYNNCFKNSILPITLSSVIIDNLFNLTWDNWGFTLKIDLKNQTITNPLLKTIQFDIEEFRKMALIKGLDEIGQTLIYSEEIKKFEKKHKIENPWLFNIL
ncbi:MAG: 3-isopropylmalate dehydratase small subunit [Candidatus Marinimicrobia bacterium]|nr:3-isopropylmalate dehydratase small subunit [Candidatus Neomarinimicrobiota bacterium]